jgi:hypothetical protein
MFELRHGLSDGRPRPLTFADVGKHHGLSAQQATSLVHTAERQVWWFMETRLHRHHSVLALLDQLSEPDAQIARLFYGIALDASLDAPEPDPEELESRVLQPAEIAEQLGLPLEQIAVLLIKVDAAMRPGRSLDAASAEQRLTAQQQRLAPGWERLVRLYSLLPADETSGIAVTSAHSVNATIDRGRLRLTRWLGAEVSVTLTDNAEYPRAGGIDSIPSFEQYANLEPPIRKVVDGIVSSMLHTLSGTDATAGLA